MDWVIKHLAQAMIVEYCLTFPPYIICLSHLTLLYLIYFLYLPLLYIIYRFYLTLLYFIYLSYLTLPYLIYLIYIALLYLIYLPYLMFLYLTRLYCAQQNCLNYFTSYFLFFCFFVVWFLITCFVFFSGCASELSGWGCPLDQPSGHGVAS